jgi:hypothetical protein
MRAAAKPPAKGIVCPKVSWGRRPRRVPLGLAALSIAICSLCSERASGNLFWACKWQLVQPLMGRVGTDYLLRIEVAFTMPLSERRPLVTSSVQLQEGVRRVGVALRRHILPRERRD